MSSDEINAYNTNIKNVADPLEDKDAANKWYVDDVIQASNNNTFAFDISSLQNGVYSIYLEAKKDGRYYVFG